MVRLLIVVLSYTIVITVEERYIANTFPLTWSTNYAGACLLREHHAWFTELLFGSTVCLATEEPRIERVGVVWAFTCKQTTWYSILSRYVVRREL